MAETDTTDATPSDEKPRRQTDRETDTKSASINTMSESDTTDPNLNTEMTRAAEQLDMAPLDALIGAQAKVLKEYTGDVDISEEVFSAALTLELREAAPEDVDVKAEVANVLRESADAAEEVAEYERENADGGGETVPDEIKDLRPPGSPNASYDHEEKKKKRRARWRKDGHISENPRRTNARAETDPDPEVLAQLQPGAAGQKAREDAAPGFFARTPGVDDDEGE